MQKKLTMCDDRAYMVTVWWTGSQRFGQVRTGVKYYFSSTMIRTLSKFGLPPKPACSSLTVPCLKLYDPPKWWKLPFIMLQLAQGVKWCEVQLFLGAPAQAIWRWKALN